MPSGFSRKKRQAVWDKTQGHCWYCGMLVILVWSEEHAPEAMQIDHQIPWSHGGTHHLRNLVPACRLCNRLKSFRTVEAYRSWLSRRSVPTFTEEHIAYLEKLQIALPAEFPCYPPITFWGEEHAQMREAEP